MGRPENGCSGIDLLLMGRGGGGEKAGGRGGTGTKQTSSRANWKQLEKSAIGRSILAKMDKYSSKQKKQSGILIDARNRFQVGRVISTLSSKSIPKRDRLTPKEAAKLREIGRKSRL